MVIGMDTGDTQRGIKWSSQLVNGSASPDVMSTKRSNKTWRVFKFSDECPLLTI